MLSKLVIAPQQSVYRTKVIETFTLMERTEKQFLGKEKSIFKYSVNDIATIVMSNFDAVKISMMSMKEAKEKFKFTTMHEGFKKQNSDQDTEIVSYILDMRNLGVGDLELTKSSANLVLVPQRRNASIQLVNPTAY